MATEELTLRIRGDIRDIKRDFRTVEQDGDRAARRVGDSFEGAGRRINAAFGALRTGALAAGAAAAGFAVLAQRSLAASENIQDLADRANVSAEFLQELRFAANQSGASARDFDDAISRLNRRLGLFQQFLATGTGEAGPAAQAFRALGLETRIASGELRDAESVFNAAVEALADVEDQSRQSAIASQLFGEDSGPRLAALVGRGTEAIATMRQEARDLGVVLENDLVREAAAASDALEKIQTQVSAEANRAIAEQADNLVSLGEALGGLVTFAIRAAGALGAVADEIRNIFLRSQEVAALDLGQLQGEAERLRADILLTGENPYADQLGPNASRRAQNLFERLQRVQQRIESLEALTGGDANTRRNLPVTPGTLSPLTPTTPGGANIPSPRVNPRTLDAAAKSAALAEFAATAKAIGQQIADETAAELERENQRIADTFGRGAADGVISALDGNLDQFLARMFRQAAFNGLSEAFSSLGRSIASGSGGGFLGGALRFGMGLLGGGKATGGQASGWTLVGEQGPELVNLGAMANVMTANMTRMALAGGRTVAPSGGSGQPILNLQTTVIDQSRGVDVSVRQISERDIQIMIDERAPRAVAGQLENQNSPVARSMRSNFQITPRRGNV